MLKHVTIIYVKMLKQPISLTLLYDFVSSQSLSLAVLIIPFCSLYFTLNKVWVRYLFSLLGSKNVGKAALISLSKQCLII